MRQLQVPSHMYDWIPWRGKRMERVFEDMKTKAFSNLWKIYKFMDWRSSMNLKPRIIKKTNTVIKLLRWVTKKILKAEWEKDDRFFFFLVRNNVSKKALEEHLENGKRKKILSTWNFIPIESIFQKWSQNKDFLQALKSWKGSSPVTSTAWNVKGGPGPGGSPSSSTRRGSPHWGIHLVKCHSAMRKGWTVDA